MPELAVWHEFLVMVGGAAAALTGLVFVAMSIHLREISSIPIHRARARATLIALVCIVLLCGLGLFPQSMRDFGLKLIVFGILLTVVATALSISSMRLPGGWDAARRLRVVIYIGTPLIVTIEGVLMLSDVDWAMAAFAATLLLVIVNAVSNAWALMLEVSKENA